MLKVEREEIVVLRLKDNKIDEINGHICKSLIDEIL